MAGKVVGGVVALARELGVAHAAVVGRVDPAFRPDFPVLTLIDAYGDQDAFGRALECLARAGRQLGEPWIGKARVGRLPPSSLRR